MTTLDLLSAIRALGALPEGYCFCASYRIVEKSNHEPECQAVREALALYDVPVPPEPALVAGAAMVTPNYPEANGDWRGDLVWVAMDDAPDEFIAAGRCPAVPIPMVMHCPRCHTQHIDEVDVANGWYNPPHRSHKCQSCDFVWRPADVATAGVRAIATAGKSDNPAVIPALPRYQSRADTILDSHGTNGSFRVTPVSLGDDPERIAPLVARALNLSGVDTQEGTSPVAMIDGPNGPEFTVGGTTA